MVLNLIYEIEENWDEENEREKNLTLLEHYLKWFDLFNSQSVYLKKMAPFEFQINKDISLRKLLDLSVPLERYLNLSIKDDQILKVEEGDGLKVDREIYPLCFVLDHLRSALNVGSLFRTAECMGIEHIYLVGYTPTPEDKGVQKTAMGTEKWVSWSQHNHFSDVSQILKEKKYSLAALETCRESISLAQYKAPKPLALLVGNERFGLNAEMLNEVDTVVSIPMRGVKNSLNVANTMSMASFEVLRQWMN